jgi:hypothetical protein
VTLLVASVAGASFWLGRLEAARPEKHPRTTAVQRKNQAEEEINPAERFVDLVQSDPNLLNIGTSKSFQKLPDEVQGLLVRTWCEDNHPADWAKLAPRDRKLAVNGLVSMLNDLLVERDFKDPPSK